MIKKERGKFLEKYIYLPLIAVLVTILFQQIFYKGNERDKQKIELRKELLKNQYQLLEKMERMIEIGEYVSVLNFQYVYLNRNDEVVGDDKEGISIDVPSIVQDKKLQNEWEELSLDVMEGKDKIDFDVYKAFEDLIKFIEKYPIPEKTDRIELIEKSRWSESEIIGRWLSLNKYLKIKIENKKELKE